MSKQIKLTQNKHALVDDHNYKWLSQWKRYAAKNYSGYYAVRKLVLPNGKRRDYFMHQQILNLECGDNRCGDHINHNTLDNREINLRTCSHQENSYNQKSTKGKSKHKGVTFIPKGRNRRKHSVWTARIGVNGKRIHLGHFREEIDAVKAYNKAARKYHGKFAYLNKS